jgi:hypothetical protein
MLSKTDIGLVRQAADATTGNLSDDLRSLATRMQWSYDKAVQRAVNEIESEQRG